MIHIVKNFKLVNEAEVDVFLLLPCFFYDPMNVGNLISGSSAFSKFRLYILGSHILKYSLKDFEHNLISMWSECNYMIVWIFFGIALLWDWNGNWLFPINLPDFRLLQSYSCQDSMILAQKHKYRPMEQDRKSRDKSMQLWTPYLLQRRQKYTKEKRQSLQQFVLGKLVS